MRRGDRCLVLMISLLAFLCARVDIGLTQISRTKQRPTTAAKGPATPSSTASSTVAKVIAVQGSVTLNRKGFKKVIPVSTNMQLFRDDMISVADPSSSVTVFCLQDFTQWDWLVGEHAVNCPSVVTNSKSTNGYARGFVVAPKQIKYTKDSKGRPITRSKGTSPQDCLVAILNSRPSTWGTSVSLKGSDPLILSGERERLELQLEKIARERAGHASNDELAILQADLHALGQDYFGQDGAIELLNGINDAKSQPYIQITLGDFYCATGQHKEAICAYTQAVTSAKEKRDILAEAVARHAIGFFRTLVEDVPMNRNPELNLAIKVYSLLGDEKTSRNLRTALENAIPKHTKAKLDTK